MKQLNWRLSILVVGCPENIWLLLFFPKLSTHLVVLEETLIYFSYFSFKSTLKRSAKLTWHFKANS